MVDIDEAVKLIEKLPYDTLQYSYQNQNFYVENFGKSKTKIGETASIECVRQVWTDAKRAFQAKHSDLFPKAQSSYSPKRWTEIVVANHLEREWFLELRDSLAPEITNMSTHYGVLEIEAEPELYKQIKKELSALETCKYEKRYGDNILFHLCTPYERTSMTILGNAGMVTGISFYPGEYEGNAFLATISQERLALDAPTSQSLANMVSFYYDDDDSAFAPKNNPFGKSNHFTSIYMNGGTMMRCYLPKSIALRALVYLRLAKRLLPVFDKLYGDHTFEGLYDAILSERTCFAFEKSDTPDLLHDIFPDILDAYYPDHIFYETGAADSWDATLRAIPAPFDDKDEPERITHWAYVAILSDHKTGYVYTGQLGKAENFRPFDDLNEHLGEVLKDHQLPKKIYVNNFLDNLFFFGFFAHYINKKKLKIVVSKKRLLVDDAADALLEQLDSWANDEDDEEEEEIKKDIRC